GYPLALPAATIARDAAGVILASGLLAAIGVGVGSLIRNQIGAVIAVLFWAFGIEQLIGALSRTTAAYLPYTAAATLAGARGGNGMPQVPAGLTPLPAGAVMALLAAAAGLIAAIAAATTVPRDITGPPPSRRPPPRGGPHTPPAPVQAAPVQTRLPANAATGNLGATSPAIRFGRPCRHAPSRT